MDAWSKTWCHVIIKTGQVRLEKFSYLTVHPEEIVQVYSQSMMWLQECHKILIFTSTHGMCSQTQPWFTLLWSTDLCVLISKGQPCWPLHFLFSNEPACLFTCMATVWKLRPQSYTCTWCRVMLELFATDRTPSPHCCRQRTQDNIWSRWRWRLVIQIAT